MDVDIHTAAMLLLDPTPAPTTPGGGAESFLKSDVGKAVSALCGAAAILIALFCVFKMVKHMTTGRPGEGFKALFGGLIVAGLLFNPGFSMNAAGAMGSLTDKMFTAIINIVGTDTKSDSKANCTGKTCAE